MTFTPAPSGLSAWLPSFVADELRPESIERFATTTQKATEGALSEFSDMEQLTDVIHQAAYEHWLAFLSGLLRPEDDFQLVEAGQQMASATANLQYPVEAIIKIYRSSLQTTWSYVTEVVSQIPEGTADRVEVLVYLWGRASRWIDASIGASIEIYHADRARLTASVSAQQFELVREILSNVEVDSKKASATLDGYPLTLFHTAFIVDTNDLNAVSDLFRIGTEIGRALHGSRPLVVHPGGRQVWVWGATRTGSDPERLDEIDKLARKHQVRVFAGIPTPGVAGFVASFRDAERVREVTPSGTTLHGLFRYDKHELVALLGCSPEVDRFMTRTLGAMSEPGENAARLRQTVIALLEAGGSVEDAAKKLCVHRNTVRYRVSRAEELLGRPVSRGGPELSLALRHRVAFHDQDDAE